MFIPLKHVRALRFIQFLFLLALTVSFTPLARAQTPPVWDSAQQMRDLAFQAQSELYAAARASDPAANYQTAASLLDDAAKIYAASLQPAYKKSAPTADALVLDSLTRARTAALDGNASALAAARGRLWTALLQGSQTLTLSTLEAGDTASAAEWLKLREYRESTRVSAVDDPSAKALADVEQNQLSAESAAEIIANDLRDSYFFRLRDALTQINDAVEKDFATRAAEWAGQSAGYFSILQADMTEKLGADETAALSESFAALESAALNEDWVEVKTQANDIHAALTNYQPVELTPAEISKRGQLLYLFTDLIYVEYKNGVRDGKITIAIEYQEAVTFHAQALAVFEELRPFIAEADPNAAAHLETIFGELKTAILNYAEPSEVKTLVDEALGIVQTTLQVSADSSDTSASFTILDTLLNEMLNAVRMGNYADAERTRIEAYAIYESGPEQRLAHRAPVLSRELEGLFWEGTEGQKGLSTLIAEKAPAEEIAASVNQLNVKLNEAEDFLSVGMSGWLAVINSLVIILREGLEAVLILGAILGYLSATNSPRKFSAWVYLGAAFAIALSVLLWWAAQSLITVTVAQREVIEGVSSLLAVVVLFYVTNWLFEKVYVVDWIAYVKEQVGKALNSGSALALAGLGFTVVFREGFETVLFYQALAFDAQASSIWLGFIIGAVIIFAIAYAILKLSKRLPLKPFFAVTGLLLMFLAFNLTGAGVRGLQEAGLVSAHLLAWIPENLILMELFGVYPTLETTLAQILFLLLLIATFSYSVWRKKKKSALITQPKGVS
ncbi:MAG TPA: FTR1 family iron permease [Anaerolineales bacterium]|nr:FTR1 family iron permease [Anaerolineales bacterium]HNQ94232.1 FTR1 family iron permease [Anaerolineales bacterium]HNS61456.1 FTR1 family iron permease [Anaerolineales bacterium]